MDTTRNYRGGFALPTVLIASVVMLTILAVSVTSVAAVRTSLKTQYYEQLAKEAGEAGVAYARACLSKNGNTPLWSNAKPLKPSTDCSGNLISGLSCPGDAGCSVISSDTVRSSFSVPAPAVNVQGKAVTIPNSGYVDLLRGSNGQVWRTYNQPAVQAAVVPDLCSGSATAGLGWSNAVASSGANIATIPDAPSATTITLADGTLPAGQLYFRRDFTVNSGGTYRVSALTNSSKDRVDLYVDGVAVASSQGALGTGTTTISAGCHIVTARLTNKTILPAYSQFTASIAASGSDAPIAVTDTAWRVSTGSPTSFSSSDFYADSDTWKRVASYSTPLAQSVNAAWANGGDTFSAMISPSAAGCSSTVCPTDSTAYMRDSKDIYVAVDTYVTASLLCDNSCILYLDGQPTLQTTTFPDIARRSLTLTAGYHHVGIQLYNDIGGALNPTGAAMSIVTSGGASVLSRTDTSWLSSATMHAGIGTNITAYESTFTPSPKEIIAPVAADILVVAGGGGGGRGGGGGGGGVVVGTSTLSVGSYSVTVGAGGSGSSSSNGTNGGNSSFSGVTALGGGGGGGTSSVALAGSAGGSGGGGGLSVTGTDGAPGGAGTAGQGNTGGYGFAYACSPAGGGGGAGSLGADGSSAKAGNGGAGLASLITGAPVYYGGGGGAGSWCLGYGIGGENAGNGATTTGTVGVASTGGGGGGGGTNGGSGGAAGGSGVVIVRIKNGSATVSATGSYTTLTPTIKGVAYTVYRFTGNGTLTVSALNPS